MGFNELMIDKCGQLRLLFGYEVVDDDGDDDDDDDDDDG